ncbi:MAG TPA: HAD-IIIC family phosphatase [Polyangia bacterium]|jgi:FkbH-like protein|nr:HAD-IIIC family phosphatase [Polyangia bacterium]
MHLESSTAEHLLQKRKGLRRELLQTGGLKDVRIAVLGGSTTNEVADFLELLLLADGFRATIYQSDYNRYYEEAVLAPEALIAFAPEIVYVHTTGKNLQGFPILSATAAEAQAAAEAEAARFAGIWRALQEKLGCQIIQNNFEAPAARLLGNLDAVSPGGRSHFVNLVNLAFARAAAGNGKLLIQDLNGIAAQVGLANFHDAHRFHAYKIVTTVEASLAVARSLASMVRSIYGKSRKCLVLDLDNTLWGGVIGDDGVDHIKIGRETAEAEAYTAFQEYCLALRSRGVLLAVCSKNEEANARQGLAHPDSVLRPEHFAAFRANWSPKPDNILSMANELNLGVDSFVFVDDNPAERALVAAQLPMVAVPDVGNDVSSFAAVLEMGRYFEPVALSGDDLQRAEQYAANSQRAAQTAQFADYGEYLASLQMRAEIARFRSQYLDRIAQLTNKTNQFNLTTRRFTLAEIEDRAVDQAYIPLYGKLTDSFGDNGLVSVVVGRLADSVVHIDLWLMSCRVLKREMELAMLDALVERARTAGATTLRGTYIPTEKNAMVADHYDRLRFTPLPDSDDGPRAWSLNIAAYEKRNRHISVKETFDD